MWSLASYFGNQASCAYEGLSITGFYLTLENTEDPAMGFWLGIPALLSFPLHGKLYFNSNLSPQAHLSPRRDTPLSSALPGWQMVSRDSTLLSTSKLAQNSLFTWRYERLSLKRSNRLKSGHLREMWISCRHKPFSKSVFPLLGWGKKISLSE